MCKWQRAGLVVSLLLVLQDPSVLWTSAAVSLETWFMFPPKKKKVSTFHTSLVSQPQVARTHLSLSSVCLLMTAGVRCFSAGFLLLVPFDHCPCDSLVQSLCVYYHDWTDVNNFGSFSLWVLFSPASGKRTYRGCLPFSCLQSYTQYEI